MKVILYRPTDQTGLGNRLRGLALCYAISLITGRRLVVDDYLITEYFDSPDGREWRHHGHPIAPDASRRVLIQRLSSDNWDAEAYRAYETQHLSALFSEDVLEVVQGASFVDALRRNTLYLDLWSSLGMDPQDPHQWMGRLVERFLSRPKPRLLRAVGTLRRRLGWRLDRSSVGVQFRTFYDIGSPHLPALPDFLVVLAAEFPVSTDGPQFFVTTDHAEATAQLVELLSRRGTVVTAVRRKVVHSGYSYQGWSELLFKIVRKILPRIRPERFDPWKLVPEAWRHRPQTAVYAEWFLLGECEELWSTFTTFAEFAAARRANQAKLVHFQPENRQVTVLKERSQGPLVSVITVSYNSVEGLVRTHDSLPEDPEIECLLIDGASTDGTVDFMARPGLRYTTLVSAPDEGIFDAMNKGLRRARGEYVVFLNCGDRFVRGLNWAAVKAQLRSCLAVHVGGLAVDDGGRVVMDRDLLRPGTFFGSSLPHQASFIPRRFFLSQGDYDLRYPHCADQEWFFRTLLARVPYQALDLTVAEYEGRGLSDDPKNALQIRRERRSFLVRGWGLWYPVARGYEAGVRPLAKRLARVLRTFVGGR